LVDFYRGYRADGHRRAAPDPQRMVGLLVYAYAVGVRSSRQIERRCWEDVAFRWIAADQTPDHATIARFRARHEQAIGDLFTDVLGLCGKAGLVKVGIVAVDGSKIAAGATHHQNRSYQQIAAEILKEAGATYAAEDELYGEKRGNELPEGFGTATVQRQLDNIALIDQGDRGLGGHHVQPAWGAARWCLGGHRAKRADRRLGLRSRPSTRSSVRGPPRNRGPQQRILRERASATGRQTPGRGRPESQ
jgi:transposase